MNKKSAAASLLCWQREKGVHEIVNTLVLEKGAMSIASLDMAKGGNLSLKEKIALCKTLDALRTMLETSEDCILKNTATQTVFSGGNSRSRIMFIGEAPGSDEDRLGEPFVGLSGKLLDKVLQSINLNRHNIYISNIVPWRPPGNRQPTSGEIDFCLPFIQKHINLINPCVLILLGSVACKALLGTKEGITKLRGKVLSYFDAYNGKKRDVFALYHPAYLLRSPGQKKAIWKDLLYIEQELKNRELL